MPGATVIEIIESRVLKGNPLGDPHVRRVPVYLPPSYGREASRRYPVYYMLTGFTGFGETQLNRTAWTETLPERCDRLIREKKMAEGLVVMPDGFTRYGGSQYINSSATGRYEDHIVREVVAHVDAQFRTIPRPDARAIMGKSSGGYGAMILGMRHPDVFGHVACHSGDMYFAYCYFPDFPRHLATVARFGGTPGFLKAWSKMPKRNDSAYFASINTIAMASCYSPNPKTKLGFDLPFDEKTGEMRWDVWDRWIGWDPVALLPKYAKNLKKLKTLYIDCGTKDQFHLLWGARIFRDRANKLGLSPVYEEFDDDHTNVQYRYDRSFRVLITRLRGLR